jgi:hypothetical protein
MNVLGLRPVAVNKGQTYAGTNVKRLPLIIKTQGPDFVAHLFSDTLRGLQIAIFKQQGELIATQPGHCVPGAYAVSQQVGQLAQEQVTRGVAAAVIDLFEAVQVDATQDMRRPRGLGRFKQLFQDPVKLCPVGQTGQMIMRSTVFYG